MKKVVVLALLLIACVGSLFAEDKDKRKKKSITDTIFRIDEVSVLEKRKRIDLLGLDVPLRFVPITVSKLSGQMLERKGIVNLEDAVKFLPGIIHKTNQLGAFQRFSIRGQGSALIMIDGMRDERTVSQNVPYGDLSSVESIELIKGPASVLAGHSAMGGVLNIVRKKVTPDFSANARISYGSWEEKRATLGFGGKLAGPLDYRANIHYSTGDGYRRTNANRFSLYGVVGANIGKVGRLEVSGSYADDKYTTEIGAAPTVRYDVYEVGKDAGPFMKSGERHPYADYHEIYNDYANNRMKRKVWDVTARYTHVISENMTLRERFTYFHSDLDYCCVEGLGYRTSEESIYKWYYTSKGKTTYINLDSVVRNKPLNFNPDHKQLSNVLELTGNVETGFVKHHYTLGWSYFAFDFVQYNGYGSDDLWGPGLGAVLALKNPQLVQGWWDSKISAASLKTDRTHAVYLHDVMEFSDQWKVMLSGRVDFYNYKTATAKVLDGKQDYKKENRSEWNKVKTSAFTYRAGVVYFPVPELSFYASASSFFNPVVKFYNPDIMYLDRKGNEFNPDTDGGEVFKPEKGISAEVGGHYTLNEWVDVNASVFYTSRYNIVKSLGDTTVVVDGSTVTKGIQGQVGRGMSKGFDFEIVVRPLPTLRFTTGLSWAEYRLRQIAESGRFSKYKEENKNVRETGVPRTTFYAYADYTIPTGVLKNLSFQLSGNFKDKVFSDIKERIYTPALWLMDAGIYYTIKGHVNLALNINNLFDKEYFEKTTVLGKPRNYQASVSYTF